MKTPTISQTSLLSTLWVFVLFNMIFRDLHQFLNPVAFQEMRSYHFSETQVLLFGFMLEIPVSMVLLSQVLPMKVNKWVNLFASLFTLLGALSTLPTADMDDVFFTLINLTALIAIGFTAWKLTDSKNTD